MEEWDLPARPQQSPSEGGVRVIPIVPLPSDAGGQGEVLVLAAFGSFRLPVGDLLPRETLFRAARRIALGQLGAHVTPQRLLYVLEQPGEPLALAVLCALEQAEEVETKPGVRFARVSGDADLDPAPLRELLVEDAQAGFIRPVAHVMATIDGGSIAVTTAW